MENRVSVGDGVTGGGSLVRVQIDGFEGVQKGGGGARRDGGGTVEVLLQYGEAKWGDHDNDNVRSALAGGLLRLMDALIISKQELQRLRVCVRACDNCLFSIKTYARKSAAPGQKERKERAGRARKRVGYYFNERPRYRAIAAFRTHKRGLTDKLFRGGVLKKAASLVNIS